MNEVVIEYYFYNYYNHLKTLKEGENLFQLYLLLLEAVYLILAFKTGKIIFYIIAFGLAIWWLHERNKDRNSKHEVLRSETIDEVEQYSYTRYRISTDYLNAIMIDEDTEKIRILEREDVDSPFEVKEYAFEDLYEIAIVEDGKNIALTSVGGVYGWSLINGGAKLDVHLNGENNEENNKEVKKLLLKIVVDDLASPVVEYTFLDRKHAVSKELDEYKDTLKECSNWYQKISIIMKRNHQESESRKEIEIKGWA